MQEGRGDPPGARGLCEAVRDGVVSWGGCGGLQMDAGDLAREIFDGTAELVKRSARPGGKTLTVSPEVAALLEGVEEPDGVAAPGAGSGGPEELAALQQEVAVCTKCGLAEGRTQTVFGDGSPNAGLVFVGEAPGFHEDKQGVPFVGAAGKLLTDIIVKGMKLKRSEVYICNVLKCRPPKNRDPRPDEKALCESYLVRQLELIRPKVICALGGHAAKMLLKTELPTGRLRGDWHFYHGIPLRVTYHPAYVLRQRDNKERYLAERLKVWDDVQHVMALLKGEERPEPGPDAQV